MDRQISCPEPIIKSETLKPEIHPQMSVVEGTKADRMQKIGKYVKSSIADFFGVGEQSEKNQELWNKRRLRYCSSIGKIKDEHIPRMGDLDEPDFVRTQQIVDPYRVTAGHRTPQSSTSTCYRTVRGVPVRKIRKDSVLKMTLRGFSMLTAARKPARFSQAACQSRSYAPASFYGDDEVSIGTLQAPPTEDTSSLVDDVFFDEPPVIDTVKTLDKIPEEDSSDGLPLTERLPVKDYYQQPTTSLPSEDLDTVDAGVGLSKIHNSVMNKVLEKRGKRQLGMGLIGRIMHRSIRSDRLTSDVKQQINEFDDHRPYFTYWVTFVQIVVFLVSISVYGPAPFGFFESEYAEAILMPNLAIEFKRHREIANMWFGPRQADLIHLGAKYSPCMRRDGNLMKAMRKDRILEEGSACCVRNDGSGCAQMTENRCSKTLSTFYKWSKSRPGPNGETAGTVCGLDPRYCHKPASQAPFEWSQDITEWLICEEPNKLNQSKASLIDRHMTCDVVARPCCHGIQGECFVTTRQHCDFVHGYYHEEAYLCSQVDCLSQICGMIPFYYKEKPDQFYRLFTALFLHGGLIHLIVTVIFQGLVMRDVEKLAGCIRIAVIYFGSGIAGNLASAIFLPYQVEAGPAGSQFGILACPLVEVLQNWQMLKNPCRSVLKFVVVIILLFIMGLLPWIDNWAHIVGFIFGVMLAFALLPYITFGNFDTRRKMITIGVGLGLSIILIIILVIFFYVFPVYQCNGCQYFNCIPFGSPKFCENMEVTIRRESKYDNF